MLCGFCLASLRVAPGIVDRHHVRTLAHLIVRLCPVVFHLEGTKVFEAMLAADFEAWDDFESWTFSFGQGV